MDVKNAAPAGTLVFIGTATTLIRYGELTLLTDPNFLHRGQRAYLGYGLTAKRLTEPALTMGQLPPLERWCCRICTVITGTAMPSAVWTGTR
jgi:hypothetical protein